MNEVKNVTCAVRLDKPLYDRLIAISQKSHKTLSEIIRSGIVAELDKRTKQVLQSEIEMTTLEKELDQVRKLKSEMEALLERRA